MSTPSLRPLALVTGASKGIGFELAKQFATNGFDHVVTAHTEALDEAAGPATRTIRPTSRRRCQPSCRAAAAG
jgi:NAD(P)-dependent dehydrogenase (short-subunit alcohol dehydrogenase family)